jgi:hypothetical protein
MRFYWQEILFFVGLAPGLRSHAASAEKAPAAITSRHDAAPTKKKTTNVHQLHWNGKGGL